MPIKRLNKDYTSIGIVIADEDEEELSFCENCYKNSHELVRLKQRIWLDNKTGKLLPSPPNADDFLQCWTCGLVVPVREAKIQGKITGIQGVEPIDNPYEDKRGIVLGLDSRLGNRIKNLKRKQKKNKHPDPEVQKELDKGNIVTNYWTSMPT
jgi:hypothetical protein